MHFPNHPFGSHFVNHPSRLVYIHIPKCASSTVKTFVESCGFEYRDHPVLYDDYQYFVVLRQDIVGRWISSSLEWWERNSDRTLVAHIISEIIALRSTGLVLVRDEHYLPQTSFILPYMPNPAVFYVEDLESVVKFLASYGFEGDLGELNVKPDDMKRQFDDALTAEDFAILNSYYLNDLLYLRYLQGI